MLNPGIKLLLQRLELVQLMRQQLYGEILDVETCVLHAYNWSRTGEPLFMTDEVSQKFIDILSSRYPESVSIALSTNENAGIINVKLSLEIMPIEKLFTINRAYNLQKGEDFINLKFFAHDMYVLLSDLLEEVEEHVQNMINKINVDAFLPSSHNVQSLTTTLFQPRKTS